MISNDPSYIFDGKRTLSDPLVELALGAVECFHDAVLDDCAFFCGGVRIRFWSPYFYDARRYNHYGVKGAELNITFCQRLDWTTLMLIYGLFDRAVYNFTPNKAELKIAMDVSDTYDLEFGFLPTQSTFEWLFQPLHLHALTLRTSS